MRQPQLLTLQNMFDTLSKDNNLPTLSVFKGGLGVVVNMSQFLQPFIRDTPSPYLLEDYRIGYIKQGYMHGIINLQEYTITAGHAVFVTPGTIVEPLDISDDFLIDSHHGDHPSHDGLHYLLLRHYLRRANSRAICQPYHRQRHFRAIHPTGEPPLPRATGTELLCRQTMYHRALPRHRDTTDQRHHGKGVDRQGRDYSRQGDAAPRQRASGGNIRLSALRLP